MNYEINVSKNNHHVFATNGRSISTLEECAELFDLFCHKFPISEGYEIDAYTWTETRKSIEFKRIKEEAPDTIGGLTESGPYGADGMSITRRGL